MERDSKTWLDTAVRLIRFGPDRRAVREELAAHLEDKIAGDLRRFPDMTREEVQERALREMGDAAEIGKALGKIHKPWLGYLWSFSRWAVWAALAAFAVMWVPRLLGLAWESWEGRDREPAFSDYVVERYLNGEDPFAPDSPYAGEGGGVLRTPLEAGLPEGTVRVGGYRLRVDRTALWSFEGENGTSRTLFCRLTAVGWPWKPIAPEVMRRVWGVDSKGNRYDNPVYSQADGTFPTENGSITVNQNDDMGAPWERVFDFQISALPPDTGWLRLEYDWEGTAWSLTIPLDVEGGGRDK